MTASDPPTAQDNNTNQSTHISLALPANKEEILKYYYNLGFALIPVDDKKTPLLPWKDFEKERPTWEQIQEWEEKLNHPNWAVICGPVSQNLIVLDFEDKRDAIAFFGSDKFNELKRTTLVIETPHNGVHLPLIAKGKIPRRQTKIFGHEHPVDLLGEGGYSLLPGSRLNHVKCKPEKPCDHKSVGEYRIISTSTDIMEAQDIEALIRKRAQELNWKIKLTEDNNKIGTDTDDEEIGQTIEILKSKDEKFRRVFDGNFKEYGYPSRSEAEEYLLVKLVSLGFSDEIINKIMLRSKTGKWAEEPEEYRKLSLTKARAYIINSELARQNPQEEKTPEKMETKQKEATEKRKGWFDENGALHREVVIDDVLKHFDRIISNNGTIYLWQEDHYDDQGRDIISSYLQQNAPEISSRVINDITEAIANITFKTREDLERMELPLDYIPVKNGLLNWRKQTLEPHNPEYFYSRRLNVNYKRGAFCRGFIKYLLSRFQGNYKEMFKVVEDLAMIFFRDNRYQVVSIWMGQSKDPSGLISGEEGKTLTAEVIFGEKFLGSELFSRASLQSLSKSDFEFRVLKDRWYHVASLDEAGHISNYSGLIEQLRDPYMEKPIKNRPVQLRWKNTTYNILTGNKFPKATANTKAFFRSIRKIVYWRKQIGEDWRYINEIDDEEKSGMLNLAIDAMNVIEARGRPYGLNDLGETVSRYREISDSLLMLASQIFEKDAEGKIEQNEALEYVIQEGEARELVMESLTKNRLTALLKENFGVAIEETTENKEVKNDDGTKTKTKVHKYYYKGIKIKNSTNAKTKSDPSTQTELSDTLEDAVLDYFSDIPKDKCIGISESFLFPLYMILYNIKEDIQDSDIPISEFKTCLENSDKSISECVSESLKLIKKSSPNLEGRSLEFFRATKDKLEFFKAPEEHLVTREPSNVIRYLQVNDKLTEGEARSILRDWVERSLVRVVNGQVVLGDKAQEDNKNDSH